MTGFEMMQERIQWFPLARFILPKAINKIFSGTLSKACHPERSEGPR
jgi:hypothetical protein